MLTNRDAILTARKDDMKVAIEPLVPEHLAEPSVGELLALVDLESERFRKAMAELMVKTAALYETESQYELREELMRKLREANQNLVLSTFAAQDLHAKAEANNLRQSEFLAMLAHELRNPMAPVVLACEILGKITHEHPQLPKLHKIISRQMSHMTHLVDDLMDASRISTGKITLKRMPVLLSDIVESAVETSQPFVDRAGHALTVNLPPETITIDGDLMRLGQVLSNLIINASKFTLESGHIVVSARLIPGAAEVSVKDDGNGIAKEFQSAIFELFTQGVASLDRPQGGLGIGLAIARTIVDMHGGSIRVESAGPGQGSEFIVTLPVEAAGTKPEPAGMAKPGVIYHCDILLIDDYVDINETMTALLEAEGHTVASAFDGATGLAMAMQHDYDVIICDIGLEGLNGYELANRLRADKSRSAPCLIAMSGYDQPVGRALALEVGFDHYLVKPIAFSSLVKLLETSVFR
jgi:signal transduction histidine kinase